MSSSNRSRVQGVQDSETDTGSVCLTEDLAYDDNATQFSGDNQTNKAEDYVDNDLEALLEDFWEEQEASGPTPGTSKQTCEVKCQSWLNGAKKATDAKNSATVKPSMGITEGLGSDSKSGSTRLPPEAEIPIEKMAALMKDILGGTRTYQTYGSDEVNGERKVPLTPISQLVADITFNLPEALMSIIGFIRVVDPKQTSEYTTQIKEFVLEVLRHLIETEAGLEIEGKEMKSPDQRKFSFESTKSIDTYFCAFKVVLCRSSKTNKFICEAVENYVNKQIETSKALNTSWICISNAAICDLIVKTNEDKVLFLAPEKVAKYANRLQNYVWDDILNRCLDLLMNWGLDLRQVTSSSDHHVGVEYLSSQEKFSQDSQSSEADLPPSPEWTVAPVQVEQIDEIGEVEILQAVAEENENYSQSSDNSNDSNYQADSELESYRDSQTSVFSVSPSFTQESSLPRRSPDFLPSCSPRFAQMTDGFANDVGFLHFGNFSQESHNSDGSNGPARKFQRLN